ncbi:uncharacterized protein G2W53_029127 [Senna tora]|uniref:Uncharacterized protein n=1 Tax=Senna tora TaxID=362788 RepID=A0A834T4R3_9FABA|nr:uncharacterized protein G2W53_029127 [Senna tora]
MTVVGKQHCNSYGGQPRHSMVEIDGRLWWRRKTMI